jgi:ATP-binding cassette subfamily F protein uup
VPGLRGRSDRGRDATSDAAAPPRQRPANERRLTYREQQELAALPDTIERLEAEIAVLHQAMAVPEFYKRPGDAIARETEQLRQLERQLAAAYHRWEELDARQT